MLEIGHTPSSSVTPTSLSLTELLLFFQLPVMFSLPSLLLYCLLLALSAAVLPAPFPIHHMPQTEDVHTIYSTHNASWLPLLQLKQNGSLKMDVFQSTWEVASSEQAFLYMLLSLSHA